MTGGVMIDKKLTVTCTFTGEEKDRKDGSRAYKVPVYEMKGYKFFLDTINVNELERDEEAQPRLYNENGPHPCSGPVWVGYFAERNLL